MDGYQKFQFVAPGAYKLKSFDMSFCPARVNEYPVVAIAHEFSGRNGGNEVWVLVETSALSLVPKSEYRRVKCDEHNILLPVKKEYSAAEIINGILEILKNII